MTISIALAVVALIARLGSGQEQKKEMPPAVARYFERSDELRKQKIADAEKRVKELTAELNKRRREPDAAKQIGADLTATKAELQKLKKVETDVVPLIDAFNLELGDVGAFDPADEPGRALRDDRGLTVIPRRTRLGWRVLEVIDGKDALMQPTYSLIYGTSRKEDVAGKPVLIRGLDTERLVTDRVVAVNGTYHVARTAKRGGVTMFEVEPVDLAGWLPRPSKK